MKSRLLVICVGFMLIFCLTKCVRKNSSPQLQAADIAKVVTVMTDVMVHDVTNPPLAARFFAYAMLAGYEVASQNDAKAQPFQYKLNEYPQIKKPVYKDYSWQLASVLAMMKVSAKMQPSGTVLMDKFEKQFLDSCRKTGFNEEVIIQSDSYASAIAKQILAYAKTDRYNRISNYKRYTPLGTDGAWYPTPPAYLQPVEPYFNTVRPFTLKSGDQFKPGKPADFSIKKNSDFYKQMLLNHRFAGNLLSPQQKLIAGFWDCNPFAVQDNGHMLVGLKKISPGAHWMGITGIACVKSKTGFSKALQIHTLVAVGLMDSFIACWDEKYRSNRIRPETAIRKYLDKNWQPLLQTPPFPEYLSGHSCISGTSSTILTHYFGDNFSYTDDVEQAYGLAPRHFTSFKQAAAEAAISRLWGGIHFIDAIENGTKQGTEVGNWALQTIKPTL